MIKLYENKTVSKGIPFETNIVLNDKAFVTARVRIVLQKSNIS